MTSSASVSPAAIADAQLAADLYLRVRRQEGRLYSDEVVARLPESAPDHPLTGEWLARRDSSARLVKYIAAIPHRLRVLEVGCGNGWLSHALASVPTARVWGLDRPGPELAQAGRLFHCNNVLYVGADAGAMPLAGESFDLIILASVIQYFRDLPGLIRRLQHLLAPGGEIHILDSPLYAPEELDSARARTAAYYRGLGFPEMEAFYFHHTRASLEPFHPQYLYDPRRLSTRLLKPIGRVSSPFPWLKIAAAD